MVNYPQVLDGVEGNPKGIVSSSPRLRARELPWEIVPTTSQPQRGCGRAGRAMGTTPLGLFSPRRGGPRVARSSQPWALLQNPFGIRTVSARWTQGSSFLATLGFVAESLWDSRSSSSNAWVMIRNRERPIEMSLANATAAPFGQRKRARGHTLIEFIGVAAVLAVLAAALVPVVIRRMDQAAWTKEVNNLGAI